MAPRRIWIAVLLLPSLLHAQGNVLTEETYLKPPKQIADLVLAPRHENVNLTNLSPDRTRCLIPTGAGMPTIAQMARPYYNLGGEQIDPKASRQRSTWYRSPVGYRIFTIESQKWTSIATPQGVRVSGGTWSPDGKQIAYWAHFDEGSYLYVADAATGRSRRLLNTPGMITLAQSIEWADGGRKLFAAFVPDGRGMPPKLEPEVPTQPLVKFNDAKRARTRTYPSLLTDLSEQTALEYFATSQLGQVTLDGKLTKIGKPGMIRSFDASPDGKFIRVTTMLKPFSYLVPVSSFGSKEELWDAAGALVTEIDKRELQVAESDTPPAPKPDAKRNLTWRPDGQGMSFLQQEPAPAKPEGGGGQEQGRRGGAGAPQGDAQATNRKDRVMQWLPPYGKDDVKVVYENDIRINSVSYSPDMQTLFMTETRNGAEHLFAVKLSDPKTKITIYTFRSDDFYKNPGSLMTTSNRLGLPVVRMSGDTVFLRGTQYFEDPDKDAPRPFIDAVTLGKTDKNRIWQSSPDRYETDSFVLDEEGVNTLVITRQSPSMPADAYLVRLQGTPPPEIRLTNNRNFAPEITAANHYRMQVTRADGFKFWVQVHTPSGHIKGNRLPAMFWFYPSEFENQQAYDRSKRTYNKNAFPGLGAMTITYLLTQGYAVIEPDAPIVAPSARMNDAYTYELRNNLAATIDTLSEQGIIDRTRLAVGGHSYGAFSTANAMIHTPFFKAGIAGDGNYNRTLTPMAFQSERRILWEAREAYLAMSPILYADQLTGALLMYHGMEDQNVGTDPINSVRMFHALLGLGKTAALYMYPLEDHGPAAQETLLDMWARWIAWLDKYVKNPAGKP